MLTALAVFLVSRVDAFHVALPVATPRMSSRSLLAMQAEEATTAPSAFIEFIEGVPEGCVPDVSLTRSRDGTTGVASFTFDNPSFLAAETQDLGETTGMYLKDDEGTIKTTEVTATFTNGKPRFVKAVVVMKGADEWDRFMRFMERYAQSNGLGFSKA
jgi:photosystem II protein